MAEKKKVLKNVLPEMVNRVVNGFKKDGCRVEEPIPQSDGNFTIVAYCPIKKD